MGSFELELYLNLGFQFLSLVDILVPAFIVSFKSFKQLGVTY